MPRAGALAFGGTLSVTGAALGIGGRRAAGTLVGVTSLFSDTALLRGTAIAGLALATATGAILFTANPAEYLGNPAFRLKLLLLAAALLNATIVTRSPAWSRVLSGDPPSLGLRVMALLSAALWLSMVLAGRWIGFL